jgi:hypothetical protein
MLMYATESSSTSMPVSAVNCGMRLGGELEVVRGRPVHHDGGAAVGLPRVGLADGEADEQHERKGGEALEHVASLLGLGDRPGGSLGLASRSCG